MLIDDDRWYADAVVANLREDYTVTWCSGAQMAIEAIDQSPPQAIVLDMLMPGGNGSVFLQELQSYTDTAMIPVILCSSIDFMPQAATLQAYGVRHVFDKAKLDFSELRATLATCVASEKVSHAL